MYRRTTWFINVALNKKYKFTVNNTSSWLIVAFPLCTERQNVLTQSFIHFWQTHLHPAFTQRLKLLKRSQMPIILLGLIPMVILASSIYPPSVTVKWPKLQHPSLSLWDTSSRLSFSMSTIQRHSKRWDEWADLLLCLAKNMHHYTHLC